MDIDQWRAEAGAAELASGNPYPLGDLDLDGTVDSTDLGQLLNNFGDDMNSDYCGGQLSGDLDIDSTDLGLLLNNFNQSAASAVNAVPEPNSIAVLLLAFLFCCRRAKRHS